MIDKDRKERNPLNQKEDISQAERSGAVQPGEKMAPGRTDSCFSVPKGGLQEEKKQTL